ncbi:MAG: gliding motility-associated-like protein [Glaciecola sp.]|jgi:gliding motility-associated-like protein
MKKLTTLSLIISFVLFALLGFTSKGQTCPSKNSWEWPSHSNWLLPQKSIIQFGNGKSILGQGAVNLFADGNCYCLGYEGTISPSDDSGNLLFYSAGKNVWDNSYKLQGAFKGNATGGQNSAVQGIVAVKHPLVPGKYHVFTGDDQVGGLTNGFNYHETDASGSITSGPTNLGFFSFEGMNATRHANGVDIWITTLQASTGIFKSFLLTCNGLNTTPVNSAIGHQTSGQSIRGAIEFSPDGSKLGFVCHAPANKSEAVVIYDFDNATGKLSSAKKVAALWSGYSWTPANQTSGYDCEFSPDGSKLYVSLLAGGMEMYDISSNNELTIFNSAKVIPGGNIGCIEMGPDGNMYHNANGNLLVSNGDLNAGNVSFGSSGLSGFGGLGLPNMYLPPAMEPDIQEVGPFCNDDAPQDLATLWTCLGTNAEDPNGSPPSVYTGKGITDAGKGIFNPTIAGPGTHEIIFTKCSVDDTIWVVVNECNIICPDTTLESSVSICAGLNLDLNALKTTVEPGAWSIISGPFSNRASLTVSNFETTNTTAAGNYVVRYTLSGASDASCPKYSERTITVNELPTVTVDSKAMCDGDTPVDFTAVSPTAINYLWSDNGSGTNQLTSGNTNGNYTVEVTDANDCKATAFGMLTVNALPQVTVNNESICIGDNPAVFIATSATAMSYVWSDNGTGTNQTTSGTTSGNYTVEVTDVSSCKSNGIGVLLVDTLPMASVNNESICIGDNPATFTATSVTATKYVWSVEGTGTNQTTTGSTAGSYSVEVEDLNGCKASAIGTLIVGTLPIVSVDNNEICSGDAATDFTASSITAVSYNWSENATGTDQITNGTTSGNYTVEVTDSKGCKSSATGVLTVHTLPIVSVDYNEICEGDNPVDFTAISSAAISYVWSENGTGNNQVTSGNAGGNYTVEITDGNGCSSSTTAALTVNELPTVSVNSESICIGDAAVTFTATSATAINYLWSDNGSGSAETTSGTTAGNYSVEVSNSKNCKASATGVLIIDTLPVVSVNTESICVGDLAAVFTATSIAATSYIWSENGTGTKQTTSGSVAGNYVVEVSNVQGCKATAIGTLIVNDLPVPKEISDGSVCPGSTRTLDVSTFDNGASPYQYLWNTGAISSSISVGPGTYHVDITDANGCKGRDNAIMLEESDLTVIIPGPVEMCEGESKVIPSQYKLVDGFNLLWSTGEKTESITVNQRGSVTLHVDNGLGCQGDGVVEVIVHDLPIVANGSKGICEGLAALIGDDSNPTYSYSWPTINNSTNAIEQVTVAGTYTRISTTNKDCEASADYAVNVESNPVVSVTGGTKCEGELVTITDANPAFGEGYLFSWSSSKETSNSLVTYVSGEFNLTVSSPSGCVGSDTATVEFTPIPMVDLGENLTICEGNQVVFDAKNSGLDILWSNRSSSSQITVSEPGLYAVTVKNGNCTASDTVILDVIKLPTSQLDKSLEYNSVCFKTLKGGLDIQAGSNHSYKYLWETGETTSEINITQDGTYSVEISVGEDEGCMITDQITIKSYCPHGLFVPNAFSPNDDFINNSFNAIGYNIDDYKMIIYDRWGIKLFETNDLNKGWDGTYKGRSVQIDVYVWKILYSADNKVGVSENHERIGRVSVVR